MTKALMCMVVLMLGCTKQDTYSVDAVSDVSVAVSESGDAQLHYTVAMESMYSSPGIRWRSKDAGTFEVVRCKVGKDCKVDLPSQVQGEVHTVRLPADAPKESLVLVDGASGTRAVGAAE